MTFASLGLPPLILKGIRATGHTEPTAIQSKSIPVTLEGNDLIAAVQSGTGKTASYLLPLLARLLDGMTRLRAIVLVPTRELAAYVETRARDYARFTDLKIGVVFTGGPIAQQEKQLRDHPVDLLVATPTRLLELQDRGALNLEDVELLVFDEADRMVSLGLTPDLRKLLKVLPETRQTLMFSLTMPPELNRFAKDALIEPVRVDLGPTSKHGAGITQAIYPVHKGLKFDLLEELLSRMEVRSMIVFARTRHAAVRVARFLSSRYTVAVLDEHPTHGERENALGDLRRGRMQILVASSAAGNSLEIEDINHVVNFDVPAAPEDYVHRLGRTGHGEPVGDVTTLMSPEEQREVAAIERFLGRTVPRVLLPDFDYRRKPREIKVSLGEEYFDASKKQAGVRAAASRIAVIARRTPTSDLPKSPIPLRAKPPSKPKPSSRNKKNAPKFVGVVPKPAKKSGKGGKAAKPAKKGAGRKVASKRAAKPAARVSKKKK